MSNDLDRLRELAGSGAPKSTENITGNIYELRDMLNEAAKPDFADIDGDGDKEEDMKDAAKDKEKTDEAVEIEEGEKPDFLKKDDDDEDDKDKTDESYDHLDEMGKFIKMAEWANSPGNQYEDRGHYSEQPEGETVDLSLRRYLDAEPHPVKVVEDHTEDGMLKEYKEFKDE